MLSLKFNDFELSSERANFIIYIKVLFIVLFLKARKGQLCFITS